MEMISAQISATASGCLRIIAVRRNKHRRSIPPSPTVNSLNSVEGGQSGQRRAGRGQRSAHCPGNSQSAASQCSRVSALRFQVPLIIRCGHGIKKDTSRVKTYTLE